MRHIGGEERACIFCSKRRRARPVCPCRNHPKLPGVAAGGCSECDPRNTSRLYDRCGCALLKLREEPIGSGDGVAVCPVCWVAWAALDSPWWVKLYNQLGQHSDALRGPFQVVWQGDATAAAVAGELRALLSVRQRPRITFEVRGSEVWGRTEVQR